MAGNKKIKILMTADTIGGVWTYAVDLAKGLMPYNVEIHLATMGGKLSQFQHEELRYLYNVKLYESNYKLEWMDSPWQDTDEAGKWLQKLNDLIKPDLIHLNNYPHGSLNWNKPVITVAHSCVLSWWKWVKAQKAPGSWDLYHKKVKSGLQSSDIVIAPTRFMLQEAEYFYGPFRNKKVIYNGRDQHQFAAGKKEPYVFSMGRLWDEAKNINTLCSAAPDLSYPVFIAGEEKEPGKSKSHRFNNVHFLGKLPPAKVSKWLSGASVYALPVKYEPFGLSALEAAFSGCALLLSDIPSLREVWTNGALYANPTDPGEWRRKLKTIMEDRELRKNLSAKSFMRAATFKHKRMALNYLVVYHELISNCGIKKRKYFRTKRRSYGREI